MSSITRTAREAPATVAICGLWIAVFVAMLIAQGGFAGGGDILSGGILPETGVAFGAQRVAYVIDAHQVWRTVTASFIHFSVMHLALNLIGMYQLGALLESWYGSAQFLGVYVVTAFVGNLLAAVAKLALAARFPNTAAFRDFVSGGGSVVVVGFVALLAVVGWRSRTAFGDFIRAQMVGILAFTAFLGLMIPQIDNFGHAGGGVAGALVGFGHRWLLGNQEARRGVRGWIGRLAVLALAGCGLLQSANAPRSIRPRTISIDARQALLANEAAVKDIIQLQRLFIEMGRRGETGLPIYDTLQGKFNAASNQQIAQALLTVTEHLESLDPKLVAAPNPAVLERLRARIVAAAARPPLPGEVAAFQRDADSLLGPPMQAYLQLRQVLMQAAAASKAAPAGKAATSGKAAPGKPAPRAE